MIQIIIDYGATIACALFTLTRMRGAWQAWQARTSDTPDKRFTTAWLHLLGLTFFLFFQIDEVYLSVDSWIGINNFSWLLSYLFMLIALYFLGRSFSPDNRWPLPWLIAGMIVVVILFFFGPGATPELTDHVVPRNQAEIFYMAAAYATGSVLLVAMPLNRSLRGLRGAQGFIRTRAIVTLLAISCTVAMYGVKFFIFSLSYYAPTLPESTVSFFTDLARTLEIGVVLLWAPAFFSNRLYMRVSTALTQPIRLYKRIRAWFHLKGLVARIERLCPSFTPLPVSNWEQLRNLNFYTYRHLIETMDGRRVLADCVAVSSQGPQQEPVGLPSELMAFVLASHDTPQRPQLVDRALEEACSLHQRLESIPGSVTAFNDLVHTYCEVERQMRRSYD